MSTFSCPIAFSTSALCSGVSGCASSYLGAFFLPYAHDTPNAKVSRVREIFRNIIRELLVAFFIVLGFGASCEGLVSRFFVLLSRLGQLERNRDIGRQIHCLPVLRRRPETN